MNGYLSVALGVMFFAGTVPMTKAGLSGFSSLEIGFSRLLIGGLLATLFLLWKGQIPLLRKHFKLALMGAIGPGLFPFLIAHSMEGLPATFGSVGLGVLPLMAGLMSILLFGEKVRRSYYIYSAIGSAAVVFYGLGPKVESYYHLAVFALAILVSGIGYASGGHLAKKTSGPLAISIVLSTIFPVVVVASLFFVDLSALIPQLSSATPASGAVLYLALFSQYLGFFPFYSGLAKVGTAKGSQIQLTQPFMSLFLAVVMLGESVGMADFITLGVVISTIVLSNMNRKKISGPKRGLRFGRAIPQSS